MLSLRSSSGLSRTPSFGIVERRVRDHEVGLHVLMLAAAERVGVLLSEVALDPANRQVHHREPACGRVRFLPVDRDVADPTAVRFDELLGLNEHPARAGAGIVDAAQDLLGAVLSVAEPDRADQVDQLAEPVLVERRPCIVFRQHVLESWIVAFDREHRLVDQLADRRLGRVVLQELPAGLFRHPEDVLCLVLWSSGSAPSHSPWLTRSVSCISSNESETYFKRISSSTTCLYSAASMFERSLSAASQSLASNPRLAAESFDFFLAERFLPISFP